MACSEMAYSEIMVAFLVLVIRINVLIVVILVLVDALLLIGVVIVAQASHLVLSRLPLLTEPVLRLPHLIVLAASEHGVVVLALIIEYFFLLQFYLLSLVPLDYFGLVLPALLVLEVVHVELVLEVVNVGVFLDVNLVVSFELGLQSLILLLVLWLDILESLESLFDPLELHLSPG